MKRIDLDEYATSAPLDLTLGEVEALRLHRAVEITPIVDGGQPRWVVRARQHVGILQLGELELRIHPKVSVDRLSFLLAYATDADGWLDSPTEVGEASDLVEAIAQAFVLHSEHALTPGILQGYVTTEDSLLTLRGRLREGDQVRARLGMPIPLEVTYDDFSSDIAENQLLRSAAEILLRFPLDAPVRHRITRLRRSLGDVTVLNVGAALPTVAFTRLNRRYRPATTLATLILRARSIEFDDPDVPGTAFLFDMNQVYEDFLTVALRRALEARGGRVAGQYRTYLDEASRIMIKPDVTWWLRSRCHAVVDAEVQGRVRRADPELRRVPGVRVLHGDEPASRTPRLSNRGGRTDRACHSPRWDSNPGSHLVARRTAESAPCGGRSDRRTHCRGEHARTPSY